MICAIVLRVPCAALTSGRKRIVLTWPHARRKQWWPCPRNFKPWGHNCSSQRRHRPRRHLQGAINRQTRSVHCCFECTNTAECLMSDWPLLNSSCLRSPTIVIVKWPVFLRTLRSLLVAQTKEHRANPKSTKCKWWGAECLLLTQHAV